MLLHRACLFTLLPLGALAVSPWTAVSTLADLQEEIPQTPPVRIDQLRGLKIDDDLDWIPDRVGETFEVDGLVTVPPYSARGAAEIRAYIADATGGLRLVFVGPDSLPALQLWDSIRVQGVLQQYRGMEYLAVSSYDVLGPGTTQEPADLLVDALNGEYHTGELVRVEGEVVWGHERVLLRDRTGSIRIYLRSALVLDERVDDLFNPGGTATVVGVLEQNDSDDPPSAGYRVTPRTREDIRMHPPDRGWILWAGLFVAAVFVGLIAWLRSWSARRESERWKDHSTRLSEEIRERENAEEARGLMEARLREAHKLESVGRLAGGIAHQFNNLLTVILGSISMELSGEDLPEETRESLEEMETAASRAAGLTDQLLAFSRKRDRDPTPVNLSSLVEDRAPILQRILGERIQLDLDLAPNAWVEVDWAEMDQALMILVQNARDVLPEGGRVLVNVGTMELDQPEVRAEGGAPGEYACLTVTDTGPGIEEEALDRIFDPFFTTKDIGKGVGLGLSTVYGIMSQSGGHLTVDSRPGEGATFSLYFPRVVSSVR